MNEGVEAIKISKSFKKAGGKILVLKEVSFTVKKGEMLLLTGRNGSGKTTMLKIISGLLAPDGGRVLLNGLTPAAAKKTIGYLGAEERALYFHLTGRQNLEFFAALYGVGRKTAGERIEKLAERLNMRSYLDLPVEDCSLGMKQRLSIAKALIHHPDVCLFDEPLKGLDKPAKKIFKELLDLLMNNKKAVIIATNGKSEYTGIKYKIRELGR